MTTNKPNLNSLW